MSVVGPEIIGSDLHHQEQRRGNPPGELQEGFLTLTLEEGRGSTRQSEASTSAVPSGALASSAKMQTAPRQTQGSSLSSHPASSSPGGGRQYTQQSSSNDPYYGRQAGSSAPTSPSSTRKAPRRPGGNETSPASPNTPRQQSHASPRSNNTGGSNMTTPRGQPLPASTNASPMANAAATASAYNDQYDQRGRPPIPPPRTSSNQHMDHSGTSPSAENTATRASTRTTDDEPSYASPNSGNENQDYGRERRRPVNQDRDYTQDDTAARSRRRTPQSPREETPQRSSSTRENRSRQAAASVQSPSSGSIGVSSSSNGAIPREGSTIINRIVVTDPAVDLDRERARQAESQPLPAGTDVTKVTGLGLVGSEGVDDGGRGGNRTRQDHSASATRRKDTKFGEYILGQTLGEGEFGKVKMGWKKEGGVQVAIKLIRKESLGTNPSRLPKIYREIAILRGLSHPNIVRLHEMVETDRHIGIILEYASGGELFDFILNHRYLKDGSARRLFAQLVSGVGYLHKKGIVHRDLKLENLLLDRSRNIIITDFGFANTFDPNDELGEDVEKNLSNREYVKRKDLDRVLDSGHRRGDLMQTSCGSPCYAAPELVVSDSLYTGRKVDVWSCGVILYAMLAGYLPFDDDPANPEGDNINLLYKYIVSTPLTFPEYVTPHARDLLRRILVPDPRKRADLFEVARHSWLSDYAHVVSFITSTTTTSGDIANTTVTNDDRLEAPLLARSASVREPSKSHQPLASLGGLSQKHGQIDLEPQPSESRTPRDAKRRTVQVEYVAPQSQTTRGDPSSPGNTSSTPRAQPRTESYGQTDVSSSAPGSRGVSTSKPLPQDPPISRESRAKQSHQSSSSQVRSQRPITSQAGINSSTRPSRDPPRSVSESAGAFQTASSVRPATGGSMASNGSKTRPPVSRGSYSRPGQPSAPAVATTNAQGRLAQPKGGKSYVISNPIPQPPSVLEQSAMGQPSLNNIPPTYANTTRPLSQVQTGQSGRGHKRSSTMSGISEKLFGRPLGGKSNAQEKGDYPAQKEKSYPPTSMAGPISTSGPRTSTDSRRSSLQFGRRKNSNIGSEKPRRFSLLPPSFSLKNFGSSGNKDGALPGTSYSAGGSHMADSDNLEPPYTAYGRGQSRSTSGATGRSEQFGPDDGYDGNYDQGGYDSRGTPIQNGQKRGELPLVPQERFPRYNNQQYNSGQRGASAGQNRQYNGPVDSDASLNHGQGGQYTAGFNSFDDLPPTRVQGANVLHKNHRKFTDAYDEPQSGYATGGQSSGSSGAARKVMDFFRRRGKARGGEDR